MVVERRDEDRRHALDRLASLERAQRAPAPQLTRIDLHFVLWNTYRDVSSIADWDDREFQRTRTGLRRL